MAKPDKSAALKALREFPVGVMATVSSEGLPWASAVHFLVDDDFSFYFMTRRSTAKFRNIAANGHAAFSVGTSYDNKSGNFQVYGKAEQMRLDADWKKFMRRLSAQHAKRDLHTRALPDDPFHGLSAGRDFAVIVLKPAFVRWLHLVKGRPVYEILLP